MTLRYALYWRRVTLKNSVSIVSVILAFALLCPPSAKTATQDEPVFRAPFKLKLHVDNDRLYEQSFDRVPYVANKDVYLFAGESFGLNITATDNEVSRVEYEQDLGKADVELRFTQEKSKNGWMMMLVIRNKLKRRLYLDALMTVPGKKEILNTNVLPVEPNLSDFESWPHPIVQLVLRNLRFSEKLKTPTGEVNLKEKTEIVNPKTSHGPRSLNGNLLPMPLRTRHEERLVCVLDGCGGWPTLFTQMFRCKALRSD